MALSPKDMLNPCEGVGDGLRLAKDPQYLNLGHLLRQLEADKPLVEIQCAENTCQLIPACGLMFALKDAQEAFFATSLDNRENYDAVQRICQSVP